MLGNVKTWVAAGALAIAVSTAAFAADANGKWSWTRKFNNNEIKQTLDLKVDGEKLTGTITGRNADQKTEIKEGKIKGNEISFVVIRKRQNGDEIKTSYTGKIDGDVIKGKTKGTFQGQEREMDWEAKRVKGDDK
jgi:hypothetical protein